MKTENKIQKKLDTELSWLTFQGEKKVLSRVRQSAPSTLPKRRAVWVFALILMLLCATAVGLVLTFTPRFEAIRTARSAVADQYGLTPEMLDLFYGKSEQSKDGWHVTLSPVSLDTERIGVYEVVLPMSGEADVKWSHDGEDTQNGDLAASAWGPLQLDKVITARRHSAENWSGDVYAHYDELTLEDKAALDAALLLPDGAASALIHIAPKGDDLTPEQAEAAARFAASEKYGDFGEALETYSLNFYYYDAQSAMEFFKQSEAHRVYRFDFTLAGHDPAFVVYLSSPTGVILDCYKICNPQDDVLPPGNLADYPDAVKEWVDNNAFEMLSAAEKAEAVTRFEAAGLRELLPTGDYLAPESVKILEAQAVAAAKKALNEQFGLAARHLALFRRTSSLIRTAKGDSWQLVWNYDEFWRHEDLPIYDITPLGRYTVIISAQDATVLSCAWSMTGKTQTPLLGTSEGWNAALIDRLIALADDYAALLKPYRDAAPGAAWNTGELTVKDDAAICEWMIKEGYPQRQFIYVLPESGDLTVSEAVALARSAVAQIYPNIDVQALPLLDLMTDCYINYNDNEAPKRCWCVNFDDGMDRYTVVMDAATGVTQGVWHDDASSGNG